MICLAIGSHMAIESDIHFIFGLGLKSNEKIVAYPYDILATIAEMGMSCQASYYCTAQSSQQDNVDNFFTHWVVCIVPYIATKASQ